MEYRILGPLEVLDGSGRPLPVAGPPRLLLLRLLVARDEPVPLEALADTLWPGAWPERAGEQLQAHLATLRRLLEPPAPAPGQAHRAGALVAAAPGYALVTAGAIRDDLMLEGLVAEAGRALDQGDPDIALDRAVAAAALGRGPALADAAGLPWAAAPARRLDDLLAAAAWLQVAARLAAGRPAEAVPDLERALRAEPDHQPWWVALAAAHALDGRPVDALSTLRRARLHLARAGGRPPGPVLLALEAAIHSGDRNRIRQLAVSPHTALPNAPAPPTLPPPADQRGPLPAARQSPPQPAGPPWPLPAAQLLPVPAGRADEAAGPTAGSEPAVVAGTADGAAGPTAGSEPAVVAGPVGGGPGARWPQPPAVGTLAVPGPSLWPERRLALLPAGTLRLVTLAAAAVIVPDPSVEESRAPGSGAEVGVDTAGTPGSVEVEVGVDGEGGGAVDLVLLARAAGLAVAGVPGELEPAVAAGLLDGEPPAGTVRFTRLDLARVVLAGLTPFRRQQLHLLLAQASAGLPDRPPGERERHQRAAGDLAALS